MSERTQAELASKHVQAEAEFPCFVSQCSHVSLATFMEARSLSDAVTTCAVPRHRDTRRSADALPRGAR
jgi:hypothetical protein